MTLRVDLCRWLFILTVGLATGRALACSAGNPGMCSADHSSNPSSVDTGVGDPIDIASGNNYRREVDFELPSDLGLALVRHYNSKGPGSRALGVGWQLGNDAQISLLTDSHRHPRIQITEGDGNSLEFEADTGMPSSATLPADGTVYHGKAVEDGKVIYGSHGWEWVWSDGHRLQFGRHGLLQKVLDGRGNSLELGRDRNGRLAGWRDQNGRRLYLIYQALDDRGRGRLSGRLIEARLPDGRKIEFQYDTLGQLSEVDEPDGHRKFYHYQFGRLVDVKGDENLSLAHYAYDAAGNAIHAEDRGGANAIDVRYETNSGLAKDLGSRVIVHASQGDTVYQFQLVGRESRLVSARGPGCPTCAESNVDHQYDDLGRLSGNRYLDGHSVRFERDRLGRMKARWERDVLGHELEIERISYLREADAWSPVAEVDRPSVRPGQWQQTRYRYDAQDRIVERVELGWSPVNALMDAQSAGTQQAVYRDHGSSKDWQPISRSWGFKYDVKGHLIEVVNPISASTRYRFDEKGQLFRIERPAGLNELHRYDDLGRLISIVPADGVAVTYGYDTSDHIESIERAGHRASFKYDLRGDMQRLESNWDEDLRLVHDEQGRVTHEIDGLGNQLAWQYGQTESPLLRVLYRKAEDGHLGPPEGVVHYAANVGANEIARDSDERSAFALEQSLNVQRGQFGSVASLKALALDTPTGEHWSESLDDFGRVVRLDSPAAGPLQAKYDANGLVTDTLDAAGNRIHYSYDDAGRLVSSQTEQDGRRVGLAQYQYLGAYLIHAATADSTIDYRYDAQGNLIGEVRTIEEHPYRYKYGYDNTGLRTAAELPDGHILNYEYQHGKVSEIRLDGRPLVANIVYQPFSERPVRYRLGDQWVEWKLDSQLAPIHLSNGKYDDERFGRDALSRIQAIDQYAPFESNPQTTSQYYGYDRLGRAVAKDERPPAAVGTQHWALSSRQFSALNKATLPLAPDVLAQGNALVRDGDAIAGTAGLVDHWGEWDVRYDGYRRLISLKRSNAEIAFQYDAFGARIGKTYNGERTQFVYDGWKLKLEGDKHGNVLRQYVWWADKPVALIEGQRIFTVFSDYRGAPIVAVDDEDSIVWRAKYDGRGLANIVAADESDARPASSLWPHFRHSIHATDPTQTISVDLRLPGQVADDETGLYYNGHRYYDPHSGKYLESDPLGLAGSIDQFAYAEGDPINRSDPTGLSVEPDDGGGTFNPALFGTLVHSEFSGLIIPSIGASLGQSGWGGGDSRNGTWPTGAGGQMPDAYAVSPSGLALEAANKNFGGTLWELKPIGWLSNPAKYAAAQAQIAGYQTTAKRGCWVTGSSSYLTSQANAQPPIYIEMADYTGVMQTWQVRFVQDKPAQDFSGLIFYAKSPLKRQTQPSVVPVPAPAPQQEDKLKKDMQTIKQQLIAIGWTTLQIIGMLALIAVAILAAIAIAVVASVVIEAILATLAAIGAALASGVGILAFIAATFGVTANAAAAQNEGQQEQQGILDKSLTWFKGLFN